MVKVRGTGEKSQIKGEASLIELEAEANKRPSASPSGGDVAVVAAEDDGGNDTDSSGGFVVA